MYEAVKVLTTVETSLAVRRSKSSVDLWKTKLYSSLTPYAMQISAMLDTTAEAAAFIRDSARESFGLAKA
jgi:hypothetical protein